MHALIIGGSIGGLAAAHALRGAGIGFTVIERAPSTSQSSTGAGLGLDNDALAALAGFGLGPQSREASLQLSIEENRLIERDSKTASVVYRDESYDNRAFHWSDLHRILYESLPKDSILFNHTMTDLEQTPEGKVRVTVSIGDGQGGTTDEQQHFEGDLLIGADGSGSKTRLKYRPDEARRYSGYCAWRGVAQSEDIPDVADAVREAYPDMGRCLYFDIAERPEQDGHAVLYELAGGRLNWLWYINQPEPELSGYSVTVKATPEKRSAMQEKAAAVWPPELTSLIKATKEPFINAIFDRQPLEQWVWGRVALLGESAHSVTPHGLRSTNMAIMDAACLGRCLKESPGDVEAALQCYQSRRIPAAAREVLFSRWLGQLKQGLLPAVKDFRAWAERGADAGADVPCVEAIAQRARAAFNPANVLMQK